VISLTATPPYDSNPQEWNRYIQLCGSIDEEIFVPELIAQKNLCPHQDYIYFNYPSKEEKAELKDYKHRAMETLNKILNDKIFKGMMSDFLKDFLNPKYNFYEDIQIYITLVDVAKSQHRHIPRRLTRLIKERRFLNKYDLEHIEKLFKYIIGHPYMFGAVISQFIETTLKTKKLIEKKQVNLDQNTNLRKTLVSSLGKLRRYRRYCSF
jgi:superfamily II DNA or RNA helicase